MFKQVNEKNGVIGGSYDLADENGKILFSVKYEWVEDAHYYANGQIVQEITGVTAHFDTKGKDARQLLEEMKKKELDDSYKKQSIEWAHQKMQKRKNDPQWKSVCKAARTLQKAGLKRIAKGLVKNYIREYS